MIIFNTFIVRQQTADVVPQYKDNDKRKYCILCLSISSRDLNSTSKDTKGYQLVYLNVCDAVLRTTAQTVPII